MWYLWVLLILSYGWLTWRSLLEASSPLYPCQPALVDCFQPAVKIGDNITLQLELHQPPTRIDDEQQYQQSSASFRWTPIDSCRVYVTIPQTGKLPELVTSVAAAATTTTKENFNRSNHSTVDDDDGNNTSIATNLCEVPLPPFARHRSSSQKSVKPLKGRFLIFLNPNEELSVLVGATEPFFLTRVKKREPRPALGSLVWNTIDGSADPTFKPSSTSRNLLQDPIPPQHNMSTTNSIRTTTKFKEHDSKTMYIPYLKFGKSPVRVRFVAEDRGYGFLQRADGLALQALNVTNYAPIIYVDELSLQHSAQIELAPPEDNKPPFRLQIKFGSISPAVDSVNRQVFSAFEVAESVLPGPELDELRYFLQDERLYRFALTQVISYVHMWLDYLAFRDEIRFYRGKQSLSGVSTSTVITRLICSVVILLYLMDGGGTSWVVLLSLFASCTVEAWKVWKLLRPTFTTKFPFVSVRQLQSEKEKRTAEYDAIALRYLAMVFYPLVFVWSLYSLKHYEYKSWYSWFISNCANAVYTFGFISLCPQLYVNYRLKSVAHLPWKVFMYKIFNTFVDDAFAWLIEMPLKHRLMTLRDDVVFVIFLVQVYLYRVDKTRTNEFGYAYEKEADGDKDKRLGSDKEGQTTTASADQGKLKEE